MAETKQPREEDFTKLATELENLLTAQHHDVQGAAIAGMLVNWLGRTPPERRQQAYEKLIKTVFASIQGLKTLAKEHEHASRRSH